MAKRTRKTKPAPVEERHPVFESTPSDFVCVRCACRLDKHRARDAACPASDHWIPWPESVEAERGIDAARDEHVRLHDAHFAVRGTQFKAW